MSVQSLKQSASRDNALRDELLRRFPTLAEDDVALMDTLDGVSDFDRQVLAVLRSADDDDMLSAGIESRMDELQARKARLDERVKNKRNAIMAAMETAGRTKVELPDATVSIRRNPPSVVITDEALIPKAFFVEQPPKLDRAALKRELGQSEVPILGAELSNGGSSLSIRRS